MKTLLPIQLNPISRRKDRSVKLSMETRELSSSELLTLMSFEGSEAWMLLSFNEITEKEIEEMPKENAELEQKTKAQRLRGVLYKLYEQEKGKTFIGTFESYYDAKMENIITKLKEKIL